MLSDIPLAFCLSAGAKSLKKYCLTAITTNAFTIICPIICTVDIKPWTFCCEKPITNIIGALMAGGRLSRFCVINGCIRSNMNLGLRDTARSPFDGVGLEYAQFTIATSTKIDRTDIASYTE